MCNRLSFSELAEESSSFVDPVVLRLLRGKLNCHNKVGGVTWKEREEREREGGKKERERREKVGRNGREREGE